ncbi:MULTISPECIES: hypothetical protein, partial [Bartonella]|uniref:hypothetical protein n=1 Tax=Bartonella TaxID=773 RepID=UPI001AEE4225
ASANYAAHVSLSSIFFCQRSNSIPTVSKLDKLTAYPFSFKDLAYFFQSSLTANSSVLYKSATHCRQRRTALVVALI